MPTLGTGYYPQGAKFALPRSFAYNMAFDNFFLPQIAGGPDFGFHSAAYPDYRFYFSVAPEFWSWSSNCYTLDHVLTQSYYLYSTDPTPVAWDFRLDFLPNSVANHAALLVRATGFTTGNTFYALPPQPSSYWLPIP